MAINICVIKLIIAKLSDDIAGFHILDTSMSLRFTDHRAHFAQKPCLTFHFDLRIFF